MAKEADKARNKIKPSETSVNMSQDYKIIMLKMILKIKT